MILYNKVQTSTHSSQALAPHKHWLQWPKTNDLGGFSMTKTNDRVLNDRKTDDLEGFLMTVLFQVTEQKPEYSQNRNKNIPGTETRIFQWLETSEIKMTRRWWCGTDLMKLQLMNGSPWTAMGALQHNKPKTRMAISWRVYVGCWRFLYQNDRLDA